MSERLEVAWSISVAILVVTSMIIVSSVALAVPVSAQSGSAPQVTDTGADQPRTTQEDTGLAITGISVADADDPDPNTGVPVVMEAKFDVNGGTVGLANTNASVISGENGTDAVTINGSVAEINDALDGMIFTPEADQNSQISSYDPDINITFTDTTNDDSTSYTVDNLAVSAVNDAPAVDQSNATGLTVDEGGSASFAAPTTSGQGFTQGELGLSEIDNNAQQTVIKIASLPGQGSLTFNGNPVTTGSTLAAEDLDNLAYIHDGTQVTSPDTDSFNLTYDDGAGGLLTDQPVTVNLEPVNQLPSVGGSVTVIEGESDVRLDNNGTLPTLGGSRGAINITDPEGDSITEYTIDSLPSEGTLYYDDNPVSAGDEVTDITQLTYSHDGTEPASDSFDVSVTDNGGGTGTPATGSGTVTLDIHPNNDDPTLTTNEEQTLSSGSSLTLTDDMLNLTDPDTTDDTLTYNVTDVPDPADGYFEVDGQTLQSGATFTQADIDAGLVQYVNQNPAPTNSTRADSFSFTVQDAEFRILPDVREGGIYDTDAQNSPLTENSFTVNVTDSVTPGPAAPSDAPTNTQPTPGGSNTASLLEGEIVTLTQGMLDASDSEQSAEEIVYRVESLAASGDIRLNGERLRVGQSFTQADINNGDVTFAHGGGEDFVDSFDYTVSDGQATSGVQTFDLNVTPQNDAPSAETDTVFVNEEQNVTLTSTNIALSDPDNSASDNETGFAINQDLNFTIDSLPGNGTLKLNGTAVTAGDNVTQAQLNNGKLEYTHDGTENFTDNFAITPLDDAGVGSGDATATNDSSTGAQANVPIVIFPINDPPEPDFVSKSQLTTDEAGPVLEGDTVTIDGAKSYDTINGVPGSGEPTPASGAHLSFGDNDSSNIQRQYRITTAPAHGQLLLNGKPVGVGSSFTQADLDDGNIKYEHDGTEGADYGNADSFDYIVGDGDWQANDTQTFPQGTSATPSTYNIDIAQRNDVPELDAPDSLDAFASGTNTTEVPDITVDDLDLDDGIQSNETDFMRVDFSVRDNADDLVDAGQLNYTATDPSGGNASVSGKGTESLIVQGTKTEIDNVLNSLTVAFSADADADDYKIRVTADDRLYDSNGDLTSGANGGPGPNNADGTSINASSNRVTQNITLRASNDNDAPNITNGNTYSVNEDSQVTLDGFTLSDVDSFGEDVTATVELYNDSERTTLADASTQGSLRLGDTTGLTSSSGDDSNTITLTGPMSDVQAALNDLQFEGAPDYNGPGNGTGMLYLRTTFEDFAHADGQKNDTVNNTIEITPVNDQPTLDVPANQSLDSGSSIAISGFNVSDTVDTDQGADDFITVDVAATLGGNPNGTINLTASGSAGLTNNGTANVTVNGTAADVQATLNSMDYAPSNPNADQTILMTVTADDRNPADTGDGNGKESVGLDGNNTVQDTFNIDVSTTNDGPSVDDPSSQSVAEDESLIFSSDNGNAFTVSDPDDFGADMVANVSVDHGTVTAASGSGADLTGDGSANLTITGTESEINAALDGLVYTPDADFHTDEVAPDNITVKVNDQGNTGTGGALIDTQEADTDVTQVNDRPVATGGPENVTETGENETGPSEKLSTLLSGNYDDSTDNQTAEGGGNTATPLSFVAITESTNYLAGQGTWQVSDGGGGWIDAPTSGLDASNALVVNASREIRFDPAADFHGTPGTLDVRLADGDTIDTINESADANDLKDLSSEGGTGEMGRWSADSVTIQTSVTNENDPPSATGDATLDSVDEDATDPAGDTVANLFGGVFDDSTDDQTGIGGNDASTSLGGIAIVGNAADAGTEGTWQYREDGATGWTTIPQGTNDDSNAILLSNNSELRFVPEPDFNGDPGSLSVRLADQPQNFDASADLSGAVGDDPNRDTDIWSDVTNLNTSVSPRNDAPVLDGTGTSATVTESTVPNDGTAPQQLVTGASVSDLDIATTSGVDEFGAGRITVSMDGGGQSFDQLTVTDSNLNGIDSVTGGSNGNDLVVNLETTATTGQVSTILEALRYNSNSDTFNGTRDITVTLSDGNNDNGGGNNAGGPNPLSDTLAASVTITEQNDPPAGSDGTVSTDEDTTYTFSAADFGYSQPGGETDAMDGVRIDTVPGSGTLELSGAPVSDDDVITQAELTGGDLTYTPPADQNGGGFTSFTFSVRDDRGDFDTAPNSLTIDVDPVNDPPSASPSQDFTLGEDDGTQTANNFMESVEEGGGADEDSQTVTFNVKDVTDGTSFTAAALFDSLPSFTDATDADNTLAFEASDILAAGESETVTVTVGVTDDGGASNGGDDTGTDQTFTITINGENDRPTLDTAQSDRTNNDGDTVSVDVSGNFSDVDANDTLTFSASGLPTGLSIDTTTGVISGTINHSASVASPYTVTITADDGSGAANATQNDSFDWAVNNPAPTATNNTGAVSEDDPTTTSGNVIVDDDGNGVDSDPDDPANQLVVSAVDGNTGDVGSAVAGSHGSVTIGSDGGYTYNLDNGSTAVQELAAGETLTDTFDYTVSDGEGGTDTATLTVTITGDTTAPEVRIDQPTEGETFATDTVAFNASGNETGDWTYSVDGATNQTGANGTQTLNETLSGLADGSHNATVYIEDDSGNVATETVNFTVDTTAPNVIIDAPVEGETLTTSDVAFNASANESGNWTYSFDGGINNTGPTSTQTLNETLSGLADGSHNATVYVEDDNGNVGTETVNFSVDTTAPTVSINSPSEGAEFSSSPTISGSSSDATGTVSNVEVKIADSSGNTWDGSSFTSSTTWVTASGTNSWTYDTTGISSEGSYDVSARATDDSGNTGTTADPAITYTIDTTPPSISNVSVSNPEGQNVSVSFDSSEEIDNISVDIGGAENATLNENDFTYDAANGTYTATYEGSSDGTYNATVETAEDGAGNDAATGQSDKVDIDTTPPEIPDNSFTATNPEGQNVSVTFNSSEELQNISVDLSGPENTTLTEDDFTYDATNRTYTATYNGSSDGTYNATLETAEDSAGNDGAEGESDEVDIDTTPPEIPDDSFTATNPEGQNVSVTFDSSEELSNISVDLSGPENATLTEDDFTYDATNGIYTATYKGSSDGTYNATLETAEDGAGNDGAEGQQDTANVDTPTDGGDRGDDSDGSDGGDDTGSDDGEGTDSESVDSDDDGLTDSEENTLGTDPDSEDSDGDGINDFLETDGGTAIDTDSDGTIDALDTDADGDGIPDTTEGTADTDGDGTPNYRDKDSDGDGIPDSTEGTGDIDDDGTPNYLDTDADGDGTPDTDEGVADADGDGIPNYLDPDDNDGPNGDKDGDGLTNADEQTLGTDPDDADSDGDGINDFVETDGGSMIDTDSDGTIDALDTDSDGDEIPDSQEGVNDVDNDGIPNYRDTDADGDGIPDVEEGTVDSDGDGIPDYVDMNTADSDTAAPDVTNFTAVNEGGKIITVSFTSDERLRNFTVSLTGPESATLTAEDFEYDPETGTYTATYNGNDGSYTATLEVAADTDDNDGVSNRQAMVELTSGDTQGGDGGADNGESCELFGLDYGSFIVCWYWWFLTAVMGLSLVVYRIWQQGLLKQLLGTDVIGGRNND